MKKTTSAPKKNNEKNLFSWVSFDYHPYHRGILWYIVFCTIFFGGGSWAFFVYQDIFMGISFYTAAAMYFFIHRNQNVPHKISIFEKGIQVAQTFFPFTNFSGYWFCVDETVSVINFQLKKKLNQKITLQLGDADLPKLKKTLEKIKLKELTDKKESLIELWARVLKL